NLTEGVPLTEGILSQTRFVTDGRFNKRYDLSSPLTASEETAIEAELTAQVERLRAAGIDFAEDLIISATHSHTAPAIDLKTPNESESAAWTGMIDAAVRAMTRAVRSMAPAELFYAEHDENPCAFVRRYFMKNGTVVTNPTRCNPDIVGPETDFDRHIRVLAVKQAGRLSAIMVNLANHCDTVGGDLVSADWPGRMEAEIQYALTEDVPVFTLTDASGNINHFDVRQKIDQTNYREAVRIGRIYGKIVTGLLDQLEPVEPGKLEVSHLKVEVPNRKITPEEYARAKQYLEETKNAPVTDGDLTSEGLANGDVTVLRYFANRVINCAEKSVKSRFCKLTRVSFGRELAFLSLPGEPFNGVAQAIRQASPYRRNLVIELAQSEGAYVPMHDCFARGGYEVQPDVNTVAPEASDILIEASIKNL
ncbi:MAG: hypothetical protein IJJ28_00825, partial [Lentisphaeria bacterium]|nr:hypothetical protein [Lentisphaeria bacterium]